MKRRLIYLYYGESAGVKYWRFNIPVKYAKIESFSVHPDDFLTYSHNKKDGDIAYISRNCNRGYVRMLKNIGVKIWYDIDDYLYALEPRGELKHAKWLGNKNIVKDLMEIADVVTFSNDYLCKLYTDMYSFLKDKAVVYKNYIDIDHWEKEKYKVDFRCPDKRYRVLYAGGNYHSHDLKLLSEFVKQWHELPDSEFLLLHDFPVPFNPAHYKRHSAVPIEVFALIYQWLNPTVVLAPLVDNDYNRCRTAIRVYQAGASEIGCVASNTPPYNEVIEHGENGFLVNTPDEWFDCVKEACDDDSMAIELLRDVRRYYDIADNWKGFAKIVKEI